MSKTVYIFGQSVYQLNSTHGTHGFASANLLFRLFAVENLFHVLVLFCYIIHNMYCTVHVVAGFLF